MIDIEWTIILTTKVHLLDIRYGHLEKLVGMIAVDTQTSKRHWEVEVWMNYSLTGDDQQAAANLLLGALQDVDILVSWQKWGEWWGMKIQRMSWKNHEKKDVLSNNLFRGLRVVFWYVFGIFLLGYISNGSNWCLDFFLKHFDQLMTWGGWNLCRCSRRDAEPTSLELAECSDGKDLNLWSANKELRCDTLLLKDVKRVQIYLKNNSAEPWDHGSFNGKDYDIAHIAPQMNQVMVYREKLLWDILRRLHFQQFPVDVFLDSAKQLGEKHGQVETR